MLLGIIADDYTGASDLANALKSNGLSTVQTIGVPAGDALPEAALAGVDALVVALKIRSVPAPEAVAQALEAARWLRARGARHLVYKICSTFDSTDAGNIGPVTEALADFTNARGVLVTPAFPETGRTLYKGHLFVGDLLLEHSPLKDHPLNPMRDSNLVRVLQRQTAQPVGRLDRSVVRAGEAALSQARAQAAEAGALALIVDSIDENDLEIIGRVASQTPLSVGASGIGIGLARAFAAERGARPVGSGAPPPVGGPVVCLAGSCSQMTLAQIARAGEIMPVLRLDVARLLDSDGDVAEAVAFLRKHAPHGPALVASSEPAEAIGAHQSRFGREESGARIEKAMADIARAMAADGVRRFVVAGGETSGAVVSALGVRAFLIGDKIAPGVPAMQTLGGARPLAMALKSGNFGDRDFFAKAIAAVA